MTDRCWWQSADRWNLSAPQPPGRPLARRRRSATDIYHLMKTRPAPGGVVRCVTRWAERRRIMADGHLSSDKGPQTEQLRKKGGCRKWCTIHSKEVVFKGVWFRLLCYRHCCVEIGKDGPIIKATRKPIKYIKKLSKRGLRYTKIFLQH